MTNQELAEVLMKGGPGSGPHPAAKQMGDKARAASASAKTPAEHAKAAELHAAASKAYKDLSNSAPRGSGVSRLAAANASYHADHSIAHSFSAGGARAA